MPEFIGGTAALMKYLGSKYQVSDDFAGNWVQREE